MEEKELNRPLISIVIPVYNAEKYLSKCIDSVLAQTYTKWELILVDDGSADSSGAICDHYAEKDSRINVIHKPNGGVGSARNTGIDHVSGDYITFIDADDYVSPGYIADFMRRRPCKKSIIVSGLITKTTKEQYISFKYADESTLKDSKANELIVKYDLFRDGGPCNKLFDLQLIKQHALRFRTDISYHEDHIFIYSYFLLLEHIILSKYCGYYYTHYEYTSKSLSNVGARTVQPLFVTSDIFSSITPKLFSRFGINDEKYKAKVLTRTGYSQRILALYNLYLHSSTLPSDCKRILNSEKSHMRQIKKEYYPISAKRRFFIDILLLPLYISHPLLLFMRSINLCFNK